MTSSIFPIQSSRVVAAATATVVLVGATTAVAASTNVQRPSTAAAGFVSSSCGATTTSRHQYYWYYCDEMNYSRHRDHHHPDHASLADEKLRLAKARTFLPTSSSSAEEATSNQKAYQHQHHRRPSFFLPNLFHRHYWYPNAPPSRRTANTRFVWPITTRSTTTALWMTTPTSSRCEGSAADEASDDDPPSPHIDSTYDYELIQVPQRFFESTHVIFTQLLKPGLIERYKVYKRVPAPPLTLEEEALKAGVNLEDTTTPTVKLQDFFQEHNSVIVADIQLGHYLDGHSGIVHGGILGLLCDDLMGFTYIALGDVPFAMTANLTLNYRQPVQSGSHVVIRMYLHKRMGRKLYFVGQVTSPDGTNLYVDVSALMIIPKEHYKEEPNTIITVPPSAQVQ